MTSRVLYLGDGQAVRFAIPFPYLSPTHVRVYVNKIEQLNPLNWSFDGTGFAVLKAVPAVNDAVEIIRNTESEVSLSQFQDGSILTEAELNLATLQNLYLIQETRDYFDSLLNPAVSNIATHLGVVPATAGEVIDSVTQGILDSALLATLQQHITDIDTNALTISGESNRINNLLPRLDGVDAAITAEQQARVDGDTATAIRLDGLQATSDGLTAQIATEQTARADADSALAQSIQTLQSFSSRIFIQATAPSIGVAPDNASSGDIWYDSSDGNHPYRLQGSPLAWQSIRDGQFAVLQAAVQTEQTARTDADSALGSRIDTVVATATTNASVASAAVQSEQTARVSADNVLASSITTVQTKVDGNTASIQSQATTLDGVTAQYTLKLDVNGHIVGMGLMNDGATSQCIFNVDQFAIVTPGSNPIVPFAVDAFGVYMPNAYIRNLAVDKITGGAIKATFNIADATGRIVLDTGTYMKVLGSGFGLNSDLIEWFGPKMDVGSCTRANGITYVATNGDAYFGGSLSAGTLYNSRQSTSVQIDAGLILGPYATNGGVKTVVLSYTFFDGQTSSGSGTGSGPETASIDLYQTIGGGAEVKVATLAVTGTHTWDSESGTRYDSWSASGSLTYTDSVPGTASRTYRAQLTSRSDGRTVQTTNQQQRITITSTEQ